MTLLSYDGFSETDAPLLIIRLSLICWLTYSLPRHVLFSLSAQKCHPLPTVSFLLFVICCLAHFQFCMQNNIKLLQLVKGATLRGLSIKYPAILNISRIGRVALMYLGGQSEETLLFIHEQSLSHGSRQSAVRRRWLSLCTVWPSYSQWPSEQISFITTMRLPILQPLCRLFLARHHITQVCQPPYSPHLAPCDFWFFPELKSPLKGRRFVNGRSHSTLAQSKASHCWLTSPTGQWLFTDAQ
jgi:hypothetical protein